MSSIVTIPVTPAESTEALSIFDFTNKDSSKLKQKIDEIIRDAATEALAYSAYVDTSVTTHKFAGRSREEPVHTIMLGVGYWAWMKSWFASPQDSIRPLLITNFFITPDSESAKRELNLASQQAKKITLYLTKNHPKGLNFLECFIEGTVNPLYSVYHAKQTVIGFIFPANRAKENSLVVLKSVHCELSALAYNLQQLLAQFLLYKKIHVIKNYCVHNFFYKEEDYYSGILKESKHQINFSIHLAKENLKHIRPFFINHGYDYVVNLQAEWSKIKNTLDDNVRGVIKNHYFCLLGKSPSASSTPFDDLKESVEECVRLNIPGATSFEEVFNNIRKEFVKLGQIDFEPNGQKEKEYFDKFNTLKLYDWVEKSRKISAGLLDAKYKEILDSSKETTEQTEGIS